MYYSYFQRDDGFGAQYQSIIWSIIFIENSGDTFVYKDIEKMICGNYDEDPEYLEKIHKYMNLRGKYLTFDKVPNSEVVHIHNVPHVLSHVQANMDFYHNSESFRKIKKAYYENKTDPHDKQYLNVAIHIRRLNKFDVGDWGVKTSLEYHLSAINRIRRDFANSSKPLRFHICSQGNIDDFNILKGDDVIFHLNENLLDTFTIMAFADVMTTTTSSFSYTAGLLNNGIVYYQGLYFWCKPMSHWRHLD